MNNEIILQGISLDDIKSVVREVLREEKEQKEVRTLTKAEAARKLEISRPTLYARMEREGLEQITTENIELLKS